MQFCNKTKREGIFLIFLLFLIIAFVLVLTGKIALADDSAGSLSELEKVGIGSGLKGDTSNLATLVGRLINVALGVLGILLVILMVIGGIIWMTSRGQAEQIQKAKDLLFNAALGLIIVILAYALTTFIVSRMTGIIQ